MNYQFPPLLFERAAHLVAKHLVYRRAFRSYGYHTFVSPFCSLQNMQFMSIGSRVTIRRGAWLSALKSSESEEPEMTIGDGTYVGNGCVITCSREVTIGRDVVFGDNVQLVDTAHRYSEPNRHLFERGNDIGRVRVGDRAWVGRNCFIGFDLDVGEGAVVGANSVVTKSVPPFTVVAGSPARALRRYDPTTGTWPRI